MRGSPRGDRNRNSFSCAKVPLARCMLLATIVVAGIPACARADERILSFDSRIVVHVNGDLTVHETIRVRAEGMQIQHGIPRDFRQYYSGWLWLNESVGFQLLDAQRDGAPELCLVERHGKDRRIYIGSPDNPLPPGEHTYELSYRTDRQLGFYADHDELSWPVTGHGWELPIDRASATVVLPSGVTGLRTLAYTGPVGATGEDCKCELSAPHVVHFTATTGLHVKEGLTIVMAWAPGRIARPTSVYKWHNLFADNPGESAATAGTLVLLVYYGVLWVLLAPYAWPAAIDPQAEPPPGLSPAAARYLLKKKFDDTAFAAAVISLAVKGALVLEHSVRTENAKDSQEYIVRRKNPDVSGLTEDERILFAALLGADKSLRFVDAYHETISKAREALASRLEMDIESACFARNRLYWFAGLALSLVFLGDLGFQCGWQFVHTHRISLVAPVLLAIGVSINWVMYHWIQVSTATGRQLLDHLLGFRLHLSAGEKANPNLQHPLPRTPQMFEKFLPYAVALGVERQWAEPFATTLSSRTRRDPGSAPQSGPYWPNWYNGADWNTLGTAGFAQSLAGGLSSAIAAAAIASHTASSIRGGGSIGGSDDHLTETIRVSL